MANRYLKLWSDHQDTFTKNRKQTADLFEKNKAETQKTLQLAKSHSKTRTPLIPNNLKSLCSLLIGDLPINGLKAETGKEEGKK